MAKFEDGIELLLAPTGDARLILKQSTPLAQKMDAED